MFSFTVFWLYFHLQYVNCVFINSVIAVFLMCSLTTAFSFTVSLLCFHLQYYDSTFCIFYLYHLQHFQYQNCFSISIGKYRCDYCNCIYSMITVFPWSLVTCSVSLLCFTVLWLLCKWQFYSIITVISFKSLLCLHLHFYDCILKFFHVQCHYYVLQYYFSKWQFNIINAVFKHFIVNYSRSSVFSLIEHHLPEQYVPFKPFVVKYCEPLFLLLLKKLKSQLYTNITGW